VRSLERLFRSMGRCRLAWEELGEVRGNDGDNNADEYHSDDDND
jgi:hypothetical protein